MSLRPGTQLGSYEILSPLGAGGMGEVYRAKDTKLDRHVAIKVLPESFALDADRVARFTREARTLASIKQPHIAGPGRRGVWRVDVAANGQLGGPASSLTLLPARAVSSVSVRPTRRARPANCAWCCTGSRC